MAQIFNTNSIQTVLGVYFKNPDLLSAAFTHTSSAGAENNEPLVFLGEKLFDFIVADYVSTRSPFSIGNSLDRKLNDFKKAFDHQSFISEKGLSKYIALSASSEALREDRTVHGDVFLAILAAIYKDSGLPALKAFILPLIRAIDSSDRYQKKNDVKAAEAESILKSNDSADKTQKYSSKKPDNTEKTFVAVKEAVKEQKSREKPGNTSETEQTKSKKDKKDSSLKPEEKNTKKGVNLFKAIIMPSKNRKKEDIPETAPEAHDTTEQTETKETQKRSFIRDALTPVTLPEHLRNPKPRRPLKASEDGTLQSGTSQNTASDSAAKGNPPTTEEKGVSLPDESENYKSLLQEYVQKNIRSASVLIKYNTQRENGVFVTEITLDGHSLSKADGSSKKGAEKSAARQAFDQITDSKSPLHSWFSSLSSQGTVTEKAPDNYVSRLNEYYQKKSHSSAAPLAYEPRPSGEKKTFAVAIVFNGEELALGSGHTLKDAKQNAARAVCEKLKI